MKEGWEKYNLMDICNVTTGKHDANHAEENGKYRFYTCSSQYVYCNTKRYEGECIILPGNGVNVGESYYFNGEFDAYQRTYVIDKIDKRIIPMFLYYHLQNNWKSEGVAKQYGSATNYIKIGNFKDYIVKSPQSLSEQQAIVDYLDSAFAKIDAMKANAEKALNEAKALFQAALKEMLEPKEGWEENALKVMSNIQSGFPFKSSQFVKDGQYQVIRMGNVRNGIIRYNESPVFVNQIDNSVKEKAMLQLGDLIITQTGSRNKRDYGFTVLIEKEGLLLNQRIARIRVKDTISNKYLLYYSWTDYFRDQYFAKEGGTVGQGNVGIDAIKDAIICYPNANEQKNIVTTLDSLKSKVDRLQENYNKISQECDALKQAILRQVFE